MKAGGEGDDRGWMVGLHHQLDGHELEQVPWADDWQWSLACYSPRGHRAGHDWVNWTELNWTDIIKRTKKGENLKYLLFLTKDNISKRRKDV